MALDPQSEVPSPEIGLSFVVDGLGVQEWATAAEVEDLDKDLTMMAKSFKTAVEALNSRIVEQNDHMIVQWVAWVVVAVIAVFALIRTL